MKARQHPIRTQGCYVIKSAESRPIRIEELRRRYTGQRATPAVVTDADRALVRAVIAHKKALGEAA